ncbi:MAG: hypothetical protein D6712_00575 [Chloroflexi bacterium]|nr:MAG: hypothetical protein D6712_00575 [Chloroflexota bacterium]
MLANEPKRYAPFFRDGLLYLPPTTIEILFQVGLEREHAKAIMDGLSLDDDRQLIGHVSTLLEAALAKLERSGDVYSELSGLETRFMFTGLSHSA